jgi:ubiquinone/menaquinone biosynthesis C-methylase UbiE
MVENIRNHAEQDMEIEMNKIPGPSKSPPRLERSDYKAVWTNLSETVARAKMNVIGTEREEDFVRTGARTYEYLRETVGVRPEDVVLEIGCGVGRVGKELAPHCRQWIGCDVSADMLRFAAERLGNFPNVELVEVSGIDLAAIPDRSIDLVYCTVVFMHLDEWDRYSYVIEAFRVLRPGGRLFVDNVNLCSDEGWNVFENHRQRFPPGQRPPHITQCSTSAELEEYLKRAGFEKITTRFMREWIQTWGIKPG